MKLGWLLPLLLSGCLGSSNVLCSRDGRCMVGSNRPIDAVIAASSAAVLFAAVGCTINGCEFPYECNPNTKRCERLHCSETSPCPSGYICDPQQLRCL